MARCYWVSFHFEGSSMRNRLKPHHLLRFLRRKSEFGEFFSPYAWEDHISPRNVTKDGRIETHQTHHSLVSTWKQDGPSVSFSNRR